MAGHIISVIGGKGGVGKSIFTVNLALAFNKELQQRVLVVDQDFVACGDMNLILGRKPPKGLLEATQFSGNLDPPTMGKMVDQVSNTVHYLSAPDTPGKAASVETDGLGRLYKAIVPLYPLTIIDCGSTINDQTLKALECSTAIFLVTNPDILVVHQTKRIYTQLVESLFPPEMIQVMINRFSPSGSVTPQTIQKNIGRPPFAAIPEDPMNSAKALMSGKPLVISAPQAPSTRAFHELVRKIHQTQMLQKLATIKKNPKIGKRPAGVQSQKVANAEAAAADGEGGAAAFLEKADNLDPWSKLKLRVHKELIERVDMKKQTASKKASKELREKCKSAVVEILNGEDTKDVVNNRDEMQQIVKEILDEALGFGPLEDLLADKSVTEIMVNARDQIFIERKGKPMLSKVNFSSDQQLMNTIERIVMPLGRRIDEKTPYVDARLPDGSRVHAIIPPLSLRGPTVTIRKFPSERLTWKHLVDFGSITKEIADFLRICVEAHLNIVVSGGTGSGKTTLLNVLSNFIPSTERIITVEDSAELQLGQEHLVRLETRPANIEGEGEVSIRDLIRNTLRMRPDRIIVGECRAGEAIDMLQAMNTGHDGSLTTVHSNNPRDCIARLETLVNMAGMGLPPKTIREQIASAVHLIIQQSRLSDGSRKVTYITEVIGMQGDVVSLQDIFYFKQEGMDKRRRIQGRFVPTGFIPKFVEDMEKKGMRISRNLFAAKQPAANPQGQGGQQGSQPGGAAPAGQKPKAG